MGTTLSGGVRVGGAPSECESTTPDGTTPGGTSENQLVIHPRHFSTLEFEVLPDELVELVLDALHGDDLARCECSCKRLRELAGNDQRWLVRWLGILVRVSRLPSEPLSREVR